MKKLSELQPEEKRILAAESCGWTWEYCKFHEAEMWHSPDGICAGSIAPSRLPDYGNDLNAMAGAMDSLNANQREDFANALCRIICGPEVEYHQMHLGELTRFANATAAQRLDAFLLAKGLAE